MKTQTLNIRDLWQRICAAPFVLPSLIDHYNYPVVAENLCCPICSAILNRPLQLPCGAVVCLTCCCKWIQYSPTMSCPCCYSHTLQSSTTLQPPSLLTSLLEIVLVNCTKRCGKLVKIRQCREHLKANCKSHYDQLADSPSKMTIEDILAKPTTSPATPAEERASEHLIRRAVTSTGVIKVRTRGQVSPNGETT